jgi:hypothetical protein
MYSLLGWPTLTATCCSTQTTSSCPPSMSSTTISGGSIAVRSSLACGMRLSSRGIYRPATRWLHTEWRGAARHSVIALSSHATAAAASPCLRTPSLSPKPIVIPPWYARVVTRRACLGGNEWVHFEPMLACTQCYSSAALSSSVILFASVCIRDCNGQN